MFTQVDTAWALALEEQEAAEAAEKCPLCGLPVSVCRDPANEFRFDAAPEKCAAAYAIAIKQAEWNKDNAEANVRSAAWSAHLKPSPSSGGLDQ